MASKFVRGLETFPEPHREFPLELLRRSGRLPGTTADEEGAVVVGLAMAISAPSGWFGLGYDIGVVAGTIATTIMGVAFWSRR